MAINTAADLMARSESTLSPDLDIYDALSLLLRRKLTGVPVVDGAGRLLGMLTEKDCLKVVVGGALDGRPSGRVEDHMTPPAESVLPTATVYDVVHLFLTRPYRKLPVVDAAGHVVGQVSRRDVLRAIESTRENTRLYGVQERRPPDAPGVDSAMTFARSSQEKTGRPRR